METPRKLEARNEFKGDIVRLFGSQKNMAEVLGVSVQTVSLWCRENPRGALRYAPEIVRLANTTYHQLVWEVIALEKKLKGED